MRRIGYVMVVMMGVVVAGTRPAFTASRPIEQLPADIVRVSTIWMEVPKQMVDVGREHGPLAAVTWGPIKGTVNFVQTTVKGAWNTVKLDQQQGRLASSGRPNGAIFRYEF